MLDCMIAKCILISLLYYSAQGMFHMTSCLSPVCPLLNISSKISLPIPCWTNHCPAIDVWSGKDRKNYPYCYWALTNIFINACIKAEVWGMETSTLSLKAKKESNLSVCFARTLTNASLYAQAVSIEDLGVI